MNRSKKKGGRRNEKGKEGNKFSGNEAVRELQSQCVREGGEMKKETAENRKPIISPTRRLKKDFKEGV